MAAKKCCPCRFFREPIARVGRFPFEQRSSPPPAALLSNIGPARIPSPPLEACRAILHQDLGKGKKMTGFRAIILALLASFLVAGCNTVKGVGRDIESVGEAGDRAI
jgi:entericidin A